MTGKIRKKLSFKHFFLKRFIPLLIAGTLLCVIGTIAIGSMVWSNYETMCSFEFASTKAAILEDNFNGMPETLMKYRTAIYSDHVVDNVMGTQKAMVIADAETGEIIVDSGFALYVFHRNEDDERPNIYICEDKVVLDFLKEQNPLYTNFYFNDMYVREDGSFLPGLVTVTEIDDGFLGGDPDNLIEKDFTPADKENYQHYSDADRLISISVGAIDDNENISKLTEAVKGKPALEAYDAVHELYKNEDNVLHTEYDTFKFKGREYALYSFATYDLWGALGGMFIVDYTILAVLILIVSAVWAKLSHTKYSAQYDSDELRRNMVNALAHDLKSPLTAISGYAENLASDTHPEKRGHYATAIMENADYMNSIITSTLELSKVENCITVNKEQVDITALVNELYEKYRPQAESKDISFTSNGSCTISADKALTSQALENLITNAVKFTPNGGSITVTAEAKSISISNTCSNTAELRSLDLTAPFVKGSESRSDRTGTGIGLAIAKNACERQKFSLELKPESKSFTATIKF